MFGLDFGEILVIVVAALIFIKPGDLPGAMQEIARWIRKLQVMAGEFHRHVDDMMKESGLDQVKKQVDEIRSLNPTNIVQDYVDPKGEIRNALTPPDLSLSSFGASATSTASTTSTTASPPPAVAATASDAPAIAAPTPEPAAPMQPIVFGPQAAPGLAQATPVASNASTPPAQQVSA
jgi:sec-independent protein translocase protein TatB